MGLILQTGAALMRTRTGHAFVKGIPDDGGAFSNIEQNDIVLHVFTFFPSAGSV